jgi:hypothetical protein
MNEESELDEESESGEDNDNDNNTDDYDNNAIKKMLRFDASQRNFFN